MRLRNVSIFKPRRRSKRHHPYLIAVTVNGHRQVTAGSTDFDDTREIAERLSRLAQRIENQISDPSELRQEIQRRKPLTGHLNAYEKHLKSSGMTDKHSLQMRLYAEESLEQFATVDDIVASEVQSKVWGMKLSAVTKNRRLYAVRSFLEWGAGDDRWPKKVVERVKLARLTQTKTKPRRVITLDELVRLIQVAESGVPVAGVSGVQRALMYRTLVSTGLRFGELTRLRSEHLSLADEGFDIPASLTKNRKRAFISLPKNLLHEIIALSIKFYNPATQEKPDSRIFPVQKFNPDRLLKHDLEKAGIPRTTERGVFDFHSLRHMTATLLAATGAQPKVIQSHMRHGSIKLTLDTYGHLFDKDRLRAAEVMGEIVQRRAHLIGTNMANKTPIPAWSDGESNPDLLNAIQASENLIEIARNELRNKRGRRIARGAPARLLGRLYRKVSLRTSKGARHAH